MTIIHCTLLQFHGLESICTEITLNCLLNIRKKNLHDDRQARVSNLLKLNIPRCVTLPFEVNVSDLDIYLRRNLIKLQSDEIFPARFKEGKHNIWKSNDTAKIKDIHYSGRTRSCMLLIFLHLTLLNLVSAMSSTYIQKLITDLIIY